MFSLHIDTARTWRGGQNQVLLTVLGLRALGHRVVLVAHPDGELRRRAEEGGDLMPLAPRRRDGLRRRLAAVARRSADLAPDVVHAHDPHARRRWPRSPCSIGAPAPRPRWSPRAASTSTSAATRSRAGSTGRSTCFIAASEAIRAMLVDDGVPGDRVVTVHEGIDVDRVAAAPPANVHEEFWLPHARAGRRQHRRARAAQGTALPRSTPRRSSCATFPDARFVIVGEGELRPALEQQIANLHLEKHVLLTGFRTDVLVAAQGRSTSS